MFIVVKVNIDKVNFIKPIPFKRIGFYYYFRNFSSIKFTISSTWEN